MSCAALNPMPHAAGFRRDPDEVMRLARMGCSHPTRLSFLRQLLRRMHAERWRFDRPVWRIDAQGVGRAVYRAIGPVRTYSLVAFAHDLPPEARSDRVIATAWDATFALFDGVPTPDDLDRLAANVPLQEAGRISARELCLSRANRSVRLFEHVVARLSEGRQPDAGALLETGYLMRTTAVYGSGKFGAADRAAIADRPELIAPFQAEMLSVWLTRAFTVDLAEHLARARGGDAAARLAPDLKRGLGVGNSTGLGMAPFLIRHPVLLNNWMLAREEALARVRALNAVGEAELAGLNAALRMAAENARLWRSDHSIQQSKLVDLRADLDRIARHVSHGWDRDAPQPWDALWVWGRAALSLEGQEALLAAMLEPHGDLIDGLGDCMDADEDAFFSIDGAMSVAELRRILRRHYAWALDVDYSDPAHSARFWYVSEEKQEPRLGERFSEPGADRELPLDTGRQAAALWRALQDQPDDAPVARFLLARPGHRPMLRRAQITARHPFAEIRDNLIAADMRPIDLLRCKLAFFGATRFDPRSDRWVRINLFQGMPHPDEVGLARGGDGVSVRPDGSTGMASSLEEAVVVALSLSELQALCAKAARGAGLDWGHAEEAGWAAVWLARRGWPAAALISAVLQGPPLAAPTPRAGAWLAPEGPLCPLRTGVALVDHAGLPEGPGGGPLVLEAVSRPALLLPFLARAALNLQRSLRIGVHGAIITHPGDGGASVTSGAPVEFPSHGKVEIDQAAADFDGAPPQIRSVADVILADLRALDALALQTTVPSSAQSLGRAGSGGDDND